MQKRIFWVIGCFFLLFVATFAFYGVKLYLVGWYTDHYQSPPIFVSTQKAENKTWHPMLTAVGTLKASNGVNVNSEVSGQVRAIDFKSGDRVKEGDLLVQLNDDIDQQNLRRDEAQLELSKVDFERKGILLKENAVSRSALDSAQAAFLQAKAAVASDNVMIGKKKIRAPFSGKLGIRLIDLGQYINSGTAIVALQALDPLFVDFSLPEQELPLIKDGQRINVSVDAYPKRVFQGEITAISSAVDVNTRSIAVRASMPNKTEMLYPGLFANVAVVLPEKENVLTVPQSAIAYSLYGDSVYVVDKKIDANKNKKDAPQLIAVQKFVKVGERRGNVVAVLQGIQAGDEVVTSGQIKLHPNAVIKINNAISPVK